MELLRALLSDTDGASASEYALMLAIVGVGIAGAAVALGNSISASMGKSSDDISTCGGNC